MRVDDLDEVVPTGRPQAVLLALVAPCRRRLLAYARPVDRYQYLILMGLCLLVTLPLELVLGARVYRQPKRLLLTMLAAAGIFVVWDIVAFAWDHWQYSSRYVTGWSIPGGLPIEELVFFLVIPICGLLTLETVRRLRGR